MNTDAIHPTTISKSEKAISRSTIKNLEKLTISNLLDIAANWLDIPDEERVAYKERGAFNTPEDAQKPPEKTLAGSFLGVIIDTIHLTKRKFPEDSAQLKKTQNTFKIFWKAIVSDPVYEKKDGSHHTRREEMNPSTGTHRTAVEHPLGTAKLIVFSADGYINSGENKITKTALEYAREEVGPIDFDQVLLLVGMFHDLVEDSKDKEGSFNKIKKSLEKYGFSHLEEYLIPILKLLDKNRDGTKLSVKDYLASIENPPEEVFDGYDVTDDKGAAIRSISIHSKFNDIIHNWKSPQSKKALEGKFPLYMQFVLKHYPDFMEYMDTDDRIYPELKRIILKYSAEILNLIEEGTPEKIDNLILEIQTETNRITAFDHPDSN